MNEYYCGGDGHAKDEETPEGEQVEEEDSYYEEEDVDYNCGGSKAPRRQSSDDNTSTAEYRKMKKEKTRSPKASPRFAGAREQELVKSGMEGTNIDNMRAYSSSQYSFEPYGKLSMIIMS